MVTLDVVTPLPVGVPVIRPAAFAVSPAGRPDTVHRYGPVPPAAASCRFTDTPLNVLWLPGFRMTGHGAGLYVTTPPVAASHRPSWSTSAWVTSAFCAVDRFRNTHWA